jgi:hypothetical protein
MSGAIAPYRYGWISPPFGDKSADYTGEMEKRSYKTLKEYAEATGQDTHSVEITYDAFENLRPAQYEDPTRGFDVEKLNFKLKAGGAAVDKAVALPNINDGYVGSAPDLGALELGAPPTHYGPRN